MKYLLLFLFFNGIGFLLSAQQFKPTVVANGGGQISNASVKMSYTIGEAVTGRISNGSVIFTEGFQQSSAGITVSVTEKPENAQEINVYPNPTRDLINISFYNHADETILIQLFDINSKLLYEKKCTEQLIEKQISLSGFPGSTYLLTIKTLLGQQLGSYKIQKTN